MKRLRKCLNKVIKTLTWLLLLSYGIDCLPNDNDLFFKNHYYL